MSLFLFTLFLGLVVGGIYSLLAFGIVLTYRVSGVFNFAQGALGMFFAFVFFQLTQGGTMHLVVSSYTQTWRLPPALAVPLVVAVLAPAFGWMIEVLLFRRLRDAGSVVQIVATIGLLLSLFGAASAIWTSATTLVPRSIIAGGVFTAGEFRATVQELTTLVIVLLLCAALVAFLRLSSLGIRMRAVVDRRDLSELMGVNAPRLSTLAWALSSGFAALAGILIAPFYGSLDISVLSLLVVAATAAAVIGRLQSLPLTLAGGMAVGVAQFAVQRYAPGDLAVQLRPSIPFLALFAFLLLPVRWPSPTAGALPRAPARHPTTAPSARAAKVVVVAAVVLLPPFLFAGALDKALGPDWQGQLAVLPGVALIFLSLVLVTGYAGQISLCQGALAGIGAFAAAHLIVDHGVPFFLAGPLGALLAVVGGAILASRAARLPPLFLGLATLAFGAFADDFLFTSKWFSNGTSGVPLARPASLASGRVFYVFGMGVFAVSALLITNLRNGKTGLALVAMRDSQIALASLGRGVARLKFVTFCLSAFLAGIGGVVLAEGRGVAAPSDFVKLQSLVFLTLAVVGGIGGWPGALVGATLFQLSGPIFHQPVFNQNVVFKTLFHGRLEALLPIFFGIGAIGLARNPHGVVEQLRLGLAGRGRRQERAQAEATTVAAERALPAVSDGFVTFPEARLYHEPSCVLAHAKIPVIVSDPRAAGLAPCPVCEPRIVDGGRPGPSPIER